MNRATLAQRTLVVLHRGAWDSPDVLLVDSDSDTGPVVVKDFAPRHPWIAWTLGRWLISRECRALTALAGHPAVPRLLGRIDALALTLEHRGGVHITRRRPWTFDRAFCDRLEAAVAGLHCRGVVHLDLRHRSNVRCDLAGRPVVIDFDSAVTFRPGGLAARWLLPWLARVDTSGLRKWRARIERDWPARQSAGEAIQSAGSRGASLPMK